MFVVIRIRGFVGVRKDIKDTLKMLNLHRKNHCVLLAETESIRGMLQKAKDYITWGKISEEMLKKLMQKRARKLGDARLSEQEVENILKEIKNGKALRELGLKPVFRLTPPSGGFHKTIKQHYPRGELSYRGDKINELLEKMI